MGTSNCVYRCSKCTKNASQPICDQHGDLMFLLRLACKCILMYVCVCSILMHSEHSKKTVNLQ